MKSRSAPAIWALFVLVLICSFSLLFIEQSKYPQLNPAANSQPGSLSLAHIPVSQGLFVKNSSFNFLFIFGIFVFIPFFLKRYSKSIFNLGSSSQKLKADTDNINKKNQSHLYLVASEKKVFDSEIEILKEELQKKEDFIAIASHELKTPLSSLKIYTQSLQLLTTVKGHQEYEHYLEKINAQIDKLSHLVSTLLDVARIEGGKITYNKENINLDIVVESIVADMHLLVSHVITIEGSTSRYVYGDKERISQVVENLLSNAVKYSPGKKKIEIKLFEKDNQAIMSITDHGIGIDEEYHKKIFDRFFRIQRDVEGAYSGMGVGLFLSCQIIEHHGGTMWLESNKGKGSTFYFSLPFVMEPR